MTCFRRLLHHNSPGTMLAHSLRPVFSGQGSRLLAANKSSTISNTAAAASSQFILFHRNFTATTAKLASVDGGDSSTGEILSFHLFIFHQRSTRLCSGNHFFHDTFHRKSNYFLELSFNNFNVSFEKLSIFINILVFALNVLHVFDSNSKGKALIKKSLT